MTTPRDAIGLSERLRELASSTKYGADNPLIEEAAAALDALRARVKELERESDGYKRLYNDEVVERLRAEKQRDAAESRATSAEQQRDEALERAAKVADKKADDFLSTAARLELYSQATKPAYTEAELHEQAGTAIKALVDDIRRLAAGTEKEKRE